MTNAAGFIMKMSLIENIPYDTETCSQYTLTFGPSNEYAAAPVLSYSITIPPYENYHTSFQINSLTMMIMVTDLLEYFSKCPLSN